MFNSFVLKINDYTEFIDLNSSWSVNFFEIEKLKQPNTYKILNVIKNTFGIFRQNDIIKILKYEAYNKCANPIRQKYNMVNISIGMVTVELDNNNDFREIFDLMTHEIKIFEKNKIKIIDNGICKIL